MEKEVVPYWVTTDTGTVVIRLSDCWAVMRYSGYETPRKQSRIAGQGRHADCDDLFDMLTRFRIILLAAFVSISALGRTAVAREDTQLEDLGWKRYSIAMDLQRDCIQRVGDLEIDKLIDDLERVVYVVNYGTKVTGSGGTRLTAVNFTEQKKVVINLPSDYDLKRWEWNDLLLHEGLEALGYDDEDYELTTALKWLSTKRLFRNMSIEEQRAYASSAVFDHFKNLKRRSKNKVYLADSGGSTSTGSGGDVTAPLTKWALLTEVFVEEEFRRTYRKPDGTQVAPRYPGFTTEQLEAAILKLRVEIRHSDPANLIPVIARDSKGRITLWLPEGERTRLPPGRGDSIFQYIMEEITGQMKEGGGK